MAVRGAQRSSIGSAVLLAMLGAAGCRKPEPTAAFAVPYAASMLREAGDDAGPTSCWLISTKSSALVKLWWPADRCFRSDTFEAARADGEVRSGRLCRGSMPSQSTDAAGTACAAREVLLRHIYDAQTNAEHSYWFDVCGDTYAGGGCAVGGPPDTWLGTEFEMHGRLPSTISNCWIPMARRWM